MPTDFRPNFAGLSGLQFQSPFHRSIIPVANQPPTKQRLLDPVEHDCLLVNKKR